MARMVAVALKWVEVIVNLPTEATFQSSRAALLSDVAGLGFMGIGTPVDGVASLHPHYFHTVLPDGVAGLRGSTEIFLRPGAEPGMVLDFTGTGNQPMHLSMHNDVVGDVLSFSVTELLSKFVIDTGAHTGEMDLNLTRLAPRLADLFDMRTLKLRAKLTAAESPIPPGGLLAWMQSPEGDLARQAIPGVASALRHNPDAVELGGAAWLAEIEEALDAATRRYLAAPETGGCTVAQLEQLLAFVLTSTRSP